MGEKFVYNTILMNEVIERLYRRCDEEDFAEICEILDKIYLEDGVINKNFRHEYSSISGKMEELRQECSEEENPFDLQNISTNVNLLYSYAGKNNKIYMKNLFKLKDHICLEIGRISYTDGINESIINAKSELRKEIQNSIDEVAKIDDKINSAKEMLIEIENRYEGFLKNIDNTNKQLKDIDIGIKSAQNEIEENKSKIKSYHQESIAILGIFAAIVLAFTGGMAFSSSVLQNMNSGSIYRVSFISILIGIVLINILFALFHYIDRLVNDKQDRSVKPLLITNAILIFILIFVFAGWYCGVAEKIEKKHENIERAQVIKESVSNNSIK